MVDSDWPSSTRRPLSGLPLYGHQGDHVDAERRRAVPVRVVPHHLQRAPQLKRSTVNDLLPVHRRSPYFFARKLNSECPKCRESGTHIRVVAKGPERIHTLRCPSCHHEWQLVMVVDRRLFL